MSSKRHNNNRSFTRWNHISSRIYIFQLLILLMFSKSKYITNLKAINFVSHIQCFKQQKATERRHKNWIEHFSNELFCFFYFPSTLVQWFNLFVWKENLFFFFHKKKIIWTEQIKKNGETKISRQKHLFLTLMMMDVTLRKYLFTWIWKESPQNNTWSVFITLGHYHIFHWLQNSHRK